MFGFTLIEVIISLGLFGLIVGGLFSLMPWGVDSVTKIKDRSTAIGLVDAVQIELERIGFSIVEHGSKRLSGLYNPRAEPDDDAVVRRLILVSSKKGGRAVLEQVVESSQSRTDGRLKVSPFSPSEELKSTGTELGGVIQFNRFDRVESDLGDLYPNIPADAPVSLVGFTRDKSSLVDPDRSTHSSERWIDEKDRYFVIICTQYAKQPTEGANHPSSRHAHHPSNGFLALQVDIQWPYKVFKYDPSEPQGVGFQIIEEKYRSKISFPVAISR